MFYKPFLSCFMDEWMMVVWQCGGDEVTDWRCHYFLVVQVVHQTTSPHSTVDESLRLFETRRGDKNLIHIFLFYVGMCTKQTPSPPEMKEENEWKMGGGIFPPLPHPSPLSVHQDLFLLLTSLQFNIVLLSGGNLSYTKSSSSSWCYKVYFWFNSPSPR